MDDGRRDDRWSRCSGGSRPLGLRQERSSAAGSLRGGYDPRGSDDGASMSGRSDRTSDARHRQRAGRPRDTERLENLVEMLRQDCDDAQAEVRALRRQNTELRADRARTALGDRSGADTDRHLRSLEERLREAHRMNEALQEDCDGLEVAVERARAAESTAQSETEAAKGESGRLRRLIREQDEELRTVRLQLDSKRDTVRDLEGLLRGKDADIARVGSQSRGCVAELEDRIMQREVQIRRLQDDVERKDAEKAEAVEALALLRRFAKEKDLTIGLLQSRCQEDTDRHSMALRQQAASQEGGLQLLEQRCEALELERENMLYEIENLRRALGQMKAHRLREREELKTLSTREVAQTREQLQRQVDELLLELGRAEQDRDFAASGHQRELERREGEWAQRLESERGRAEERAAELRSELGRMQDASSKLSAEMREMEAEWGRRLSEKDDAIGGAAAQVREAEQLDRVRERERREAAAAAEAAGQRERDAEQERDEAVAQLEQVAAELATAQAARDALAAECEELRSDAAQLRDGVSEREAAIEDLGAELSTRETRVAEIEQLLDSMRMEMREKDAEVKRYRLELDQALAIGEELQKTADIVQTTNRRREELLREKELDFRKQADRLKAQEQVLQDLRNRNGFLEEEVGDRDAQIHQLEAMLDEQVRVADGERQALLERERQQREDASRCQGEVRAAARARAECKEDAERAREDAAGATRAAAELKAALQERDEEAADLRQRVQGLLARLDGAEEKMHKERRDAKAHKASLLQLQQQLHDAEARADDATAKASDLRSTQEAAAADASDSCDTLRRLCVERLLRPEERDDPASQPDFPTMGLWQLSRELERRVRAAPPPGQSHPAVAARDFTVSLWLERLPPAAAKVVAQSSGESDSDDEPPSGMSERDALRWQETRRRMQRAALVASEVAALREQSVELESQLETARIAAESWADSRSRSGGAEAAPRRRSAARAVGGNSASRRSATSAAATSMRTATSGYAGTSGGSGGRRRR